MQDQVGINCRIEIELIDAQGNAEPMAFDLVRDSAADLDNDFIGEGAPLAKAIRGKKVGATVPYRMGDIEQVRILQITRSERSYSDDATSRRQEVLEEALRKAERTNAEMFAASYDGKWGDYELGEEDESTE